MSLVKVGSCKSIIRKGQPCNSFPRSWLMTDFSIPHCQNFVVTLFSTQSNQHKVCTIQTASVQLDEGFGMSHLSKEMDRVWLQCWDLNSPIILGTRDLKGIWVLQTFSGNLSSQSLQKFRFIPSKIIALEVFQVLYPLFGTPKWTLAQTPLDKPWPLCAEAGRREDQGRLGPKGGMDGRLVFVIGCFLVLLVVGCWLLHFFA